jgi:hypothetical protein
MEAEAKRHFGRRLTAKQECSQRGKYSGGETVAARDSQTGEVSVGLSARIRGVTSQNKRGWNNDDEDCAGRLELAECNFSL